MYFNDFREFEKYKINIGLALLILFLCLGYSSRVIPMAFLIQKAIALGSCILLLAFLGPDKRFFKFLIFYVTIVVVCYLLRDQYYVGINTTTFIKAVLGVGLFYLVMSVNFGNYIYSVSTAYVLLPIIMVPISFVFAQVFGFTNFQDGRYGAGLASAHYAFLSYFAVLFMCYYSLDQKRFSLMLYGLCVLLLLLSGSRGPLIAVFIPSLLLVRFIKRPSVRQKILLLSPIILFVLVKFLMSMIARTEMETFNTEGSFNLSGRDVAWEYFLAKVHGLNLFGGGLGSTPEITKGVREFNLYLFVAPHNEFIKFFMELGIIGCTLFFINIFLMFKIVFSQSRKEMRSFFILAFLGFMIITIFDNTFSTVQAYIPLALFLKYAVHNEQMRKTYATQ
ncbi:O-antigen ligase family protein [Vibrio sp. AK197]